MFATNLKDDGRLLAAVSRTEVWGQKEDDPAEGGWERDEAADLVEGDWRSSEAKATLQPESRDQQSVSSAEGV